MYGGGYNGLGFFCLSPFGAAYVARRCLAYRVFFENSRLFHSHLRSRCLARSVFILQKCFCRFLCAISAFKSTPESSLGAFSTFGSVPEASPACFLASKALSLLSSRIFSLQKHFRCFPRAISAFKSTFVAFLAHFQPSKVLPKPHSARFVAPYLAYRVFLRKTREGGRENTFNSVQTKIIIN